MSKDSTAAQLYEAVGKKRLASLILEYFIAHYDKLRKLHKDCPDDDPVLWLHFNQQYLADKFHVSVQTIARHIKHLCRLKYVTLHQNRGYDRSYSYIINRAKVGTIYQSMPLFEDIEQSHQPIKMIASNLSKCQDATCQNDSFQPIKMSACSISSYPFDYSSSSMRGTDDAETKNHSWTETKSKLQPVQSHEGKQPETSYDAEKAAVIQQFRQCNIVPEHAEAEIARYGLHLCKAVVTAVELKKRRGEKVQGLGGGLIMHGLKNPASLGLEMTKQGQWLPAHLIAKQLKLTASSAVQPKLLAWDALTYDQQKAIRDKIDAAHPDKSQAARFQLYKKAAELGTFQASVYQETQETAVHEATSVSAQVPVHS